MKKITILITDDHQLIREGWALMLNNDERFHVTAIAASGDQAIELAKSILPDIVLMDINMAGMNGFEATEIIKSISPGTKVIGVTMHSSPFYAKKMISKGASGFVTKNSTAEELIQAILEVHDGRIFICDEVKNILSEQEQEGDLYNPGINSLSKRELEVVQYIKNGFSSKEISGKLGISSKTIEVHRYNILKKLAMPNTAALVNFVNANGFLVI